jgi:hypothetical protein
MLLAIASMTGEILAASLVSSLIDLWDLLAHSFSLIYVCVHKSVLVLFPSVGGGLLGSVVSALDNFDTLFLVFCGVLLEGDLLLGDNNAVVTGDVLIDLPCVRDIYLSFFLLLLYCQLCL